MQMKMTRGVQVFLEHFSEFSINSTYPLINWLFFAICLLKHASHIAKMSLKDGRTFLVQLQSEIFLIQHISISTLVNSVQEISIDEPYIELALSCYQKVQGGIKMYSKRTPSIQTLCFLFIENLLNGEQVTKFVRDRGVNLSYIQIYRSHHMKQYQKQYQKQKKKKNDNKFPVVLLKRCDNNE